MKKHLALVLALVMVLTSFSFVSAAPDFSDMEGHVNAEAVARLEALNVLKGYPDGTFKPDDTITRAEFAAVAVRISGLENVAMAAKGLPTGFTDVPAHHWASGYVGTAAKSGIVVGIGNGLFAPESPVKYEEAITMIVRALGYEPMAQARGGYPFGYLIVANEIDLLDGAMGTQGTWATRGFVAQITDNALEIEMMIQVGYGSDTKWVVSGKEGTEKEFLLGRMGFEFIEGRVLAYDVDDLEIEIDDETFEVLEGFAFYEAYGVDVKAWYNSDDVVVAVTLNDDVVYDAIEIDGDELTLVNADKDYDFDGDAVIYVDGSKARLSTLDGNSYDYAKVVLDGDVMFVDAYTWDGFIAIEDIDGYDVFAYGGEELDVEDFTIVKDGSLISAEELEVDDVLFYNDDAEFAEVYNEIVEGEIGRIYADRFALEGDDYKYVVGDWAIEYLDENDDLNLLDKDVAQQFKDEGPVNLFLNRAGDGVYIVGDLGVAETDYFYAYVTEGRATDSYNVGRKEYYNLTVLTDAGEEVEYDIEEKYIVNEDLEVLFTDIDWDENDVVKVTIDEDGDIVDVEVLALEDSIVADDKVEVGDRYALGYRLLTTAVAFDIEEYDGDVDDIIVSTLADADFVEIHEADIYVNDKDEVVVLVVNASDRDTDATEYDAVATADAVELRDGETWRLELVIDGEEDTYFTKDEANIANAAYVEAGDLLTVKINDTTGEVDEVVILTEEDNADFNVEVMTMSTSARTINGGDYRLADAVILDGTDDYAKLNFRDLNLGDKLDLLLVSDTSSFVVYAVRTFEGTGESTGEAVDITFDVDSATATLIPVNVDATWGRTVNVVVEPGTIGWDEDFDLTIDPLDLDVTVDKALVSASGIKARSVSGVDYDGSGNVVFTVVFEADVYDGDTLELAAGAVKVVLTEGQMVQTASHLVATTGIFVD